MCSIDGSAGGDRVDAFQGPDGRFHLIVLDACGHGAQAEHIADMALYTIRTLLWQGLTPAVVFGLLNQLCLDFCNDGSETSFGSGAIASIDPDATAGTFASAGHVDVLRFRADGQRFDHCPTGPLFGVTPHTQYRDERFAYRASEIFVFFTDGLTDIRVGNGFLGTSGVISIVKDALASASGISSSQLITRVRRLAGGAFNDDAAAMIVSLSGSLNTPQ
ncbi:MAG: serine/threonine-protein phosphatase [Candidatus Eremiobacteraeota bacterium]|nr:serine/threonine-protein phosphatase [Candidatus Eremiobacteraeota bacterium]